MPSTCRRLVSRVIATKGGKGAICFVHVAGPCKGLGDRLFIPGKHLKGRPGVRPGRGGRGRRAEAALGARQGTRAGGRGTEGHKKGTSPSAVIDWWRRRGGGGRQPCVCVCVCLSACVRLCLCVCLWGRVRPEAPPDALPCDASLAKGAAPRASRRWLHVQYVQVACMGDRVCPDLHRRNRAASQGVGLAWACAVPSAEGGAPRGAGAGPEGERNLGRWALCWGHGSGAACVVGLVQGAGPVCGGEREAH